MCSCLVTVALLWQKLSQPKFYKDLTRKTAFFDDWSWFNFNNLALVLGTSLKFYTSMAKGLKLKVRKFWGLTPTFVEVTGGKLVEGALLPSPSLLILNRVKKRYSKTRWGGFYYLQELRNTYVFYTWHFPMMHVLSPWHYLHNLCSKWSCSKWFRHIPVDMQPIPIVSMTFIWRFWKGINLPRD